jgi:histidine triad (HIT) family protein
LKHRLISRCCIAEIPASPGKKYLVLAKAGNDERVGCKFCEIVAGVRPAGIVYEDNSVAAFLDNRPLFPGHMLLIPKRHVETLGDLPEELLAPLFGAARLLSRAVETGLHAEGSFVAINNRVSQSVPHLHVHIVPRRRKDGLKGFFWPRQGYRDEGEMTEVRDALRRAVALLDNGGSRGES